MAENKTGLPKKLCPFSMSLALPVKPSPGIFKGGPEVSVRIGGPCAGPSCMWWSAEAQDCVVFQILDELQKFNRPTIKN